jgi:hypothetical protein
MDNEPLREVGQVGDLFREEVNAARCVFFAQIIPTPTGAPKSLIGEQQSKRLAIGTLRLIE